MESAKFCSVSGRRLFLDSFKSASSLGRVLTFCPGAFRQGWYLDYFQATHEYSQFCNLPTIIWLIWLYGLVLRHAETFLLGFFRNSIAIDQTTTWNNDTGYFFHFLATLLVSRDPYQRKSPVPSINRYALLYTEGIWGRVYPVLPSFTPLTTHCRWCWM